MLVSTKTIKASNGEKYTAIFINGKEVKDVVDTYKLGDKPIEI